ncbi:protein LEAD-SENSITIVE 1-like [Argentina anserina]|uniref:protein LEAD-SENSITIVE 1-like n=1 Tax=Argentina anserina TaxID=57926 RepID=UPI00217641B6|nr:protein LEAD-SENSITIVE 1-like [Potentilla anserina]
MLHITNKIDRESLKHGDHIYAYRKCYTYSHHGIFVEGDTVIHFNMTQEAEASGAKPCKQCGVDKKHLRGVVKSCVDCFLKGSSLRRYGYGVRPERYIGSRAGTCTTGRADPPEVTISRANDLFDKKAGFGDYDLFQNNCEAFAVLCKTGKRVSDQAGTAKLMIRACKDLELGRLLRDVSVHYGDAGEEKINKLKQLCDSWFTNTSTIIKLIASLQIDQDPGQKGIIRS